MTIAQPSPRISDRDEAVPRTDAFTTYGVWVLLAIILFAAVVRFVRLTEDDLWLDETASWLFATQSWSFLWNVLPAHETNPPHYYMMLKAWIGVAGTSETAMRIPSAIASTIVVYLMFVSGRIVGGTRHGWHLGFMAALICAAWQFQIGHGANARGFAFASLGTALMMTGCLQLVVFSRESGGRAPYILDGAPGNTKAFIAIAFGASLSLASHFLGLFSVSLAGLFLLAWWAVRHHGDRRLFLSLALTAAVILAIYAPYLPKLLALVFGGVDDLSGIAFLEPPSFRWLIGLSSRAFGQRSFELGDAQVIVDAGLVALGAFGFWRIVRPLGTDGFWVMGLLALLIAGFWLVLVLVTYMVQPVLQPRSLIFAQVPLLLVIAAAPWAVSAGRTALMTALLAFILVGSLRPLNYMLSAQRTYDTMVATIAASDAPDAPVIIIPYLLETGLLCYENELRVTLNRRPYPRPFDLPNQPVPVIDAATARSIVEGLRGEQTVWLLELRLPIYDPSGELFRQLEADGFTQRLVVYGDNPADQETLSRFDRAVAD
jgi:mannosyltransferase